MTVAFPAPAPAPYRLDPGSPTEAHASIPSGDLLGDDPSTAAGVEQDPDAPHLPPRPQDEHPAWAHTSPTPPPSMPVPRDAAATEPPRGPEQVDPAIAQLKSMFPDFDDGVL